MQAILWPLISWVFREIVIKFVLITGLVYVVTLLVPLAVGYLGNFLGVGSLSSAFSSLPAGVWFFLDYFQVSFGLPLLISAWVSRFLIRRLPVIG